MQESISEEHVAVMESTPVLSQYPAYFVPGQSILLHENVRDNGKTITSTPEQARGNRTNMLSNYAEKIIHYNTYVNVKK